MAQTSGGSGSDAADLPIDGPDERIAALVNEFFERRQAGETLSPTQFAAEHADLAEALRPYLEGLALIDQARVQAGAAGPAAAAAPEPPPGTMAGYELRAELGRGGMGVVYRALQVSTKRIVALKVMLAGPFASPAARRRFEREVELAARLQHPNIVRVLDSGVAAGQRYYAMDYVPGRRLDQYLAAEQPEHRTIVQLFAKLADAADYAHRQGVVHRDLKPANVLVDEAGEPHVLDFGLAKAADQPGAAEPASGDLSRSGQVVGTLFYLSPEQAAGRPAGGDVRTDVYALGVMLFEALTGRLPFDQSGRPSDVIQRILESSPPRPRSLARRLDRELETIVLKALEKEPARRYQSAGELAEDLRRFLAGEPIHARPPSRVYVLSKRLRKHVRPVAAAAVTLVLVAAGLAVQYRRSAAALAAGRREVVDCLHVLETEPSPNPGQAESLFARFPDLPEAALVLGQALYRNEKSRERAILFLERRLEAAPQQWYCRALLAEIQQAVGNTERAAALRAQADRDAPDTPDALYLRTLATLSQPRARELALAAVDRAPGHPLAWRRLAWLHLAEQDLEGALAAADRLLALGEERWTWILFKAQILARQRRFEQAVEQYTHLLNENPPYLGAYAHRAHVYRRLKQHDRAVDDYTAAIAAERPAPDVWHIYQRATPLWILGRREEAVADYQTVRQRLGRPSYADARHFLILRELGRPEEAAQVIGAALAETQEPWLGQIFACLAGRIAPEELVAAGRASSNREHPCEAYYYAGEACRLNGRQDEARRWFELCVQTGVEFDTDTAPAVPMNEYELAEWRLSSAGESPIPGSRTQHP